MKKVRAASFATQATLFLAMASNAFAQTATSSASKGGTSSALPNAGTVELTYVFFAGGVALFVFGMIKLVSSLRDPA